MESKQLKPATRVNEHPTKKRKTNNINVVSGPKLVFDLKLFPKDISFEQQTQIVSEFFKIYCFNKEAKDTLPIKYLNVKYLTWKQLFHRFNGFGWNKKIVEYKNKQIKDEFSTDDLIYLSPCAENACDALDDSKCYIINVYDKNTKIPEIVTSENIKCQRLPVDKDKLTVEEVAKMLINVKNGKGWNSELDE